MLIAPTARATPTDNLLVLANNFPVDTTYFMVTQTDDEFINTLDTLVDVLGNAVENVGSPLVSPVSFRLQDEEPTTVISDLLDEFAFEVFDGDFDSTIRPWLGDTAAVAITDVEQLTVFVETDNFDDLASPDVAFPFIIALELADPEATRTTLESAAASELASGEMLRVDVDQYTLYRIMDVDISILIQPDKLIFGKTDTILNSIDVPAPTLADNPDFIDIVDTLPEDDYAFLVYADYPRLLNGLFEITAADPTLDLTDADLYFVETLADTLTSMVFAGTLLDDRTLTLDIAQRINSNSADDLSLQTYVPMQLDPTFASRFDADTALIIFQDNLTGTYEAQLNNLRVIARLQEDVEGIPSDEIIREEDIDGALFVAEFTLRTATGLDLQDDILSWMGGNYALALSISPDVAEVRRFDSLRRNPIGFAIVFDVTGDPDGAVKTRNAMEEAFSELLDDFALALNRADIRIDDATETISGIEALVYTITDLTGEITFPVEVLVATNADVFVIGTREMVTTALNNDGTLVETQAFQEGGMQYALDNSGALYLVNNAALTPLADLYRITDATNPYVEQTAQSIRQLIDLSSSLTISTSMPDETTAISRATISLNLPD